ncbi:MAG: hypothetical protein ACI8W8_000337 [Rhodothermales bacterium]|jgi:hypothetical protein
MNSFVNMGLSRLKALILLFFSLTLLAELPIRFDGRFTLEPGDTVVTLGDSNAEAMRQFGFLETSLQLSFPDARARFRNMAWQADTVFQQQRPRNFGDLPSHLRDVGASVIFLHFGRAEVIEQRSVSDFINTYSTLVKSLLPITERIVVVVPFPFEAAASEHLPDMRAHNALLAEYAQMMHRLAEIHGIMIVDLFSAFRRQAKAGRRLTSDGVRLTPDSQRKVAKAITAAMRLSWNENEDLRTAVIDRNQLWHRYWRPTNWAFLRGNRTHVPSSRDHKNSARRWFPEEIEALLPVITKADKKIAELATASQK